MNKRNKQNQSDNKAVAGQSNAPVNNKRSRFNRYLAFLGVVGAAASYAAYKGLSGGDNDDIEIPKDELAKIQKCFNSLDSKTQSLRSLNPKHYDINGLNALLCSKFPDTVQHAIEFTKEIRLCNKQECDDYTKEDTGGFFHLESKEIIVNKNELTGIASLLETVLHELTHALQNYEEGYFNMPSLESI
ncbi:hypothetical protein [Candidatus Deianiraea vastatrix]|uniref:Uncharacterized protein n=1 Tax=Candidatus Deianiraea vastatrix TaxID=2163644 RepID=A0A5B8XG31_9RICK|nr:hypothetical protein [Candidatus Deianiraea vastatrix]QED22927.1 hypothetical protein Deia_00115 [Candidatus Deianiraea vastatrix]